MHDGRADEVGLRLGNGFKVVGDSCGADAALVEISRREGGSGASPW